MRAAEEQGAQGGIGRWPGRSVVAEGADKNALVGERRRIRWQRAGRDPADLRVVGAACGEEGGAGRRSR